MPCPQLHAGRRLILPVVWRVLAQHRPLCLRARDGLVGGHPAAGIGCEVDFVWRPPTFFYFTFWSVSHGAEKGRNAFHRGMGL